MSQQFKKFLFYGVWLLAIVLGPVTIFNNTPLRVVVDNDLEIINLLQRITGLLAFTLLSFQLVLGSLMPKLIERLGGWIFNFHITEGLGAWGIMLLHPTLFLLLNYKIEGLSTALLTFVPRFSPPQEVWYSLGKFALVLISIAVLAGYFREKPALRRNWRKFHILNYFAFVFVAIHSYYSGTDAWTPPFSWFYWMAIGTVVLAALSRVIRLKGGLKKEAGSFS
jgi:predicted ferric reductase